MLEIAKRLIALKEEKKEIDRTSKELSDEIKEVEAELADNFVENGVSSIGVDGKNVVLVEKNSVKCDQSREIVEWLEIQDADVWNKPINPASLTKYVNEHPESIKLMGEHIECKKYYQFQVRKK